MIGYYKSLNDVVKGYTFVSACGNRDERVRVLVDGLVRLGRYAFLAAWAAWAPP